MSKYKKINTEFRNAESLKKALTTLGVQFQASRDGKSNTVTLETHWRSFQGSDQKVAIAIQRMEAIKARIGSMDGVGFEWNGTGYELVRDHSDEYNNGVTATMNRLRQEYAREEFHRMARIKGYGIQEIHDNGTIRLKLVRR